jgi:putative N-acetyltransferase (TIGR04045 family)
MIFDPFAPFTASAFQVKAATEGWERVGARLLRHQVFCFEQGMFGGADGSDADATDAACITLVALTHLGIDAGDVVGTVRIHEAESGIWWGSRLAVARPYRRAAALGPALIRLAVSTAHAHGCRRFLADVQPQNAPLFRRMHWHDLAELDRHGRPHQRMQADLAFYPPFAAAATGFYATARAPALAYA